jgi:hypothetical protein
MAPKPVTHLLRPAKPFAQEYKLTLADRIPPAINSRYLFVYKAPDSTEYQKSLTERLSRALTSFLCQPEAGVLALPQLAGKIYSDKKTARLSLKVTKESAVKFVVSHRSDITYKQLRPDQGFPMRYLDGKTFATGLENIPGPDRSGGLEAFSAQITFITGGFVLCVNKHHFLLDANSTGKLIQWWLKRARSYMPGREAEDIKFADPSMTLAMHDNSSLMLETSVPAETHEDWKVIPDAKPHVFGQELPPATVMFIGKMLPSLKPKIENAVFHFSAESLAELHTSTSAHATETFSKHDAVSALLWRCVTRARMFSVDALAQPDNSMLALAVNGRQRLEPKMAAEYFGNAAFFAPTVVPIPILTSTGAKSLADVALAIRGSIAKNTTNSHFRSLLQLIAAQKKTSDVVNACQVYMGKDVMLTSWERMFGSLKDLDVGVGSFQSMRLPDGGSFDGLGMVMPCYGLRDSTPTEKTDGYGGGLEVSLDLLHTHMESLKTDEEWTRYARWTEK